MMQTYDLQSDEMFELQTQLILNRFLCGVRLAELERTEEEKKPSAEDSARAAKKKQDSEEYLRHRLKQIEEWERRISGEK